MKYRESGMPDEQLWSTFFNSQQLLSQMGIDQSIDTLVDIGCGYGTFLIPASKLIRGTAVGIDIESEMIEVCEMKMREENIVNIDLICGDITIENTLQSLEKYKSKIDYITLFNILHCEQPVNLLEKVYGLINNNGKLGVIHWKHEKTPRGPSMGIRPIPETIISWAAKVGLSLDKYVELPPHHFGLVFTRNK